MILTTPEIICLAVTAAIGVCGILEDNGLWRLPVPFMKRIPARPLRRSSTSLHARRIRRDALRAHRRRRRRVNRSPVLRRKFLFQP